MDVNAASSTSSTSGKSQLFSADASSLGKEDFLKLLVAQLSNQDPMEPLSNDEFIAQMATFSQLEQMTNLNRNFSSFMKGQEISQYSSMIGKKITGITQDGATEVEGVVESISIVNGTALANVDTYKIPFENIKEITTATK